MHVYARAMLRRNTDIKAGLVNATIGTVHAITGTYTYTKFCDGDARIVLNGLQSAVQARRSSQTAERGHVETKAHNAQAGCTVKLIYHVAIQYIVRNHWYVIICLDEMLITNDRALFYEVVLCDAMHVEARSRVMGCMGS